MEYHKLEENNKSSSCLDCFKRKKNDYNVEEKLNQLIRALNVKSLHLKHKMEKCQKQSRFAKQNNDMTLAKSFIIQYKSFEKTRNKYISFWTNLKIIVENIQDSQVNFMVAGSMMEGNEFLKNIMDNFDNMSIEDIMDNLAENMEEIREVGETLASPLEGDDFIKDEYIPTKSELEKEDNLYKKKDKVKLKKDAVPI